MKQKNSKIYSAGGRSAIGGLFIWLLIFCVSAQAAEGGGDACSKESGLTELTLEEAGLKFRELRKVKGHFNGGTWNPIVDKWMGRKHELMIHIAGSIKKKSTSESELESLLGGPDNRLASGDFFLRLIKTLPDYQRFLRDKCAVLVYQWRGNHDVLFFVSQAGSIVEMAWWYAGE